MRTFKLSKDVERELAEIFTPAYMEAVKTACGRYLYESGKKKPGVAEDGKTLIEIGKRARELEDLLRKSRTALQKVNLHVSEKYGKHDTLSFIENLKEQLQKLDDMCEVNPAKERAENPPRGRPKGSRNVPEWALAFELWQIYKKAHGETAPRIVSRVDGTEEGPLPRGATILGPVLGLPSNLAREFRDIEQNYRQNRMDIK